MKKPQYITIAISLLALCLLWAFAKTVPNKDKHPVHTDTHQHDGHPSHEDLLISSFSVDSAISTAQMKLPIEQRTRVEQLKNFLQNEANPERKLHLFHQLSLFWKDTAKSYIPFVWYTAEGARLENSEKNLNFAGHLFLNNLQEIENVEMRRWMALQAKDLFERSLSLNPDNDSAKVGLGSTYIFGGISNAPMQGIAKIREVVEKDSNNVYAQMTLAMGSLMSGQTEKARERLEVVASIDDTNIQAILLLADIYERQGQKENAVKWYRKALRLVSDHSEMKAELEKRINTLK